MFSFIDGKIVGIEEQLVTVQCGGFGLMLNVARSELYQHDQVVKVWTYLHWNQEQGPTLFGFTSQFEKEIFELVISCSGIGPRIGLAVLASLTPIQFLSAVHTGDDKALSAVNGIGRKKAEHIIVQLRDKTGKLLEKAQGQGEIQTAKLGHWNNLTQVLQSLNYSRVEIERALAHLRKQYAGATVSFDELVRAGLSFLAKKL